MYAAKTYPESVSEYLVALKIQPGDATLKRSLERASKKIGSGDKIAHAHRSHRSKNKTDAADGAGETDGDSAAKTETSAPSETATDEQK